MSAQAHPVAPVVARLEAIPGSRLRDKERSATCPAHEDKVASLSWTVDAEGKVLLCCHAGCTAAEVVTALGADLADLYPPRSKRAARVVRTTEYEVRDATGELVAIHVRRDLDDGDKHIAWRLAGAPTDRYGLGGRAVASLPLYGTERLADWPAGAAVAVTEGEKAAHALLAVGRRALATYGISHRPGPGPLEVLRGRPVLLWPDADPPGRAHMLDMAARLEGIAAGLAWLEPPPDAPKGWDAADALALADDPGALLAALRERVGHVPGQQPPTEPAARRVALESTLGTFRRWLHMPDPGALLVTLATVAANRAEGDPLWLLLIGPPGGGKTEILNPLARQPDCHMAATVTEAALLSGTPKREKASDAKGGLLREIGSFGIVVLKDFTSILSMHRDARAAVLAALREIYDGAWTRHVGTDGGRALSWAGKVGLIAGCTPVIDSHHAVIGSMGERFMFFRLPATDADKQAARALAHVGHEAAMREGLAGAVADVLAAADREALTRPADQTTAARLIAIATLAVRCRSSVERDGRTREVELVPEPEAPARLALVLLRLLNGLRAIGVGETTAWRLVAKAALDSMPALRLRVLEHLVARGKPASTREVADAVEHPTTTARRALEDLAAHGVLRRLAQEAGKADLWEPTPWTLDRWAIVAALAAVTVPEMSGDGAEVAGTVPEMSGDGSVGRANGAGPSSIYNPHRVFDDFSGTVPQGPIHDTRQPGLEDDYPASAWAPDGVA